MLYLSLSYYLLPSIAITLKVRKRKLFLQSAAFASATELSGSSCADIICTNLEKISQLPILRSSKEADAPFTHYSIIGVYALENDIIKRFSTDFFQKAFNATTRRRKKRLSY
jgi:hypothetical protein